MDGTIDKELLREFEGLVAYQIGRNYKKGILGKARLKWKMTKVWNSRFFKVGIPADVKGQLGEQEALRLFQDTCDKIVNNPTLLNSAVQEARTQDMFNQIN